MLTPIAVDKKIELSASYAENCIVLASEEDVYQIIVNLTENAIKYTDNGGAVSVAISGTDDSSG